MKSMGVTFSGLSFDWGTMQKGKDDTVSGLTKGIEGLFKKNKVRGGAADGWEVVGAARRSVADGASRQAPTTKQTAPPAHCLASRTPA
jgi:pyruvate/2-oxoglutarate dehydrogenase complex dihydrolipoamide dehydrogenase (E3) component